MKIVADDEDIATVKIPAGKDWCVVKACVEKGSGGSLRYTGLSAEGGFRGN